MSSLAYSKWMAVTFSPGTLITSLSSGAEQITGYAPQELVGQPVTQILADRSVFELPNFLDSAEQWGYWAGEIIHRTRGGATLEAHSTLSLLSGPGNQRSGFLLLSNLDNTFPEGQGDTPLGTISAKLRMFSHELNNSLAVIMGFAQLITINPDCRGKIRDDIDKLYSEVKRIIEAVDRIHGYAVSLSK